MENKLYETLINNISKGLLESLDLNIDIGWVDLIKTVFNNFKSEITFKLDIGNLGSYLTDDQYVDLLKNCAGYIIEQYIYKLFTDNLIANISNNYISVNNVITQLLRGTKGTNDDITVIFDKTKKLIDIESEQIDKNVDKQFKMRFEVKSYNRFSNITLSDKQRQIDNVMDTVYILCGYKINNTAGNKTINITDIEFVVGKDFSDDMFKEGLLKSKHLSAKSNRIKIYKS